MTPNRPRLVLLLLLAIGPLCGCGYKGALYAPKPQAGGTTQPAVVIPKPAPDRPTPTQAVPPPQ